MADQHEGSEYYVGKCVSARWRDSECRILWVEPHNPPVNALGSQLRQELIGLLERIQREPTVRVVILAGNEAGFCGGGDFKELRGLSSLQEVEDFTASVHAVFDMLGGVPVPVIALVTRHAIGGGLELLLRCDLRYAHPDAVFAAAGANVGLIEGGNSLPQAVGDVQAREMLFTGRRITAAEAHRIGLINAVVTGDSLEEHCLEVASHIATRAPLSLRALKDVANQVRQGNLVEANRRTDLHWARLRASSDHREAIRAFLEKRPPEFEGQ